MWNREAMSRQWPRDYFYILKNNRSRFCLRESADSLGNAVLLNATLVLGKIIMFQKLSVPIRDSKVFGSRDESLFHHPINCNGVYPQEMARWQCIAIFLRL